MSNFMIPNNARNNWTTIILEFQSTIIERMEFTYSAIKNFVLHLMFHFHNA